MFAAQALGLAVDDRLIDSATDVHTVLSEPVHRDARFLYDEWRRYASTGGFMVGMHVPSRALGRVLPALSLYDPVDGGRDFHVRLAGTALRRRFGRDITGSKLSDVFSGKRFDCYAGRMRRVLKDGEPFFLELRIEHLGLPRLRFEWLGLQVFSPDCRQPWIMTGHFLYAD
ncbi:MAG TPA: PAS domain-containing protein [Rhizomicrobium sp.]|nr:PAS domain-containing protein [Rhizomicrobium sp.]